MPGLLTRNIAFCYFQHTSLMEYLLDIKANKSLLYLKSKKLELELCNWLLENWEGTDTTQEGRIKILNIPEWFAPWCNSKHMGSVDLPNPKFAFFFF